jgi:DNA transformation protein and related proteins
MAIPERLKTVLELLDGIGQLRHRKMFGGIYIYCDDLFIATIHDDKLYFKANKKSAKAFIDQGLAVFSYLKNGEPAYLQYYEAPPVVLTSRAEMKTWASLALIAARQDASVKRQR